MVTVEPLFAHKCDANCRFDNFQRCRSSGLRHVCGPVCQETTTEGDRVCTWTGLVAAGRGDAIDRSVANNTPRTSADAPGGGRAVAGFFVPAKRRNELGPGDSLSGRRSAITSRKKRLLLPANVPNSEHSRNRYVAARQLDVLFFRKDLLLAVQDETARRQGQCMRSQLRDLRRRVECGSCEGTYLDVVREELVASAQHPLCQTVSGLSDTLRNDLRNACLSFLLCGWARLSTTLAWRKKRPDFQSYVMGVIYICREGGELVQGYPLIPRVPFFEAHTPCIGDLGHLHRLLDEQDGRQSLIGRRRIMEGRNAIRQACLSEMQHRSISAFALELSPLHHAPLARTYSPPGSDPVWGVAAPPAEQQCA